MRIRMGKRYALLALATVGVALPGVADSNYVGGPGVGNWSIGTNWNPAIVPAGASVTFINSDSAARTLIYDYTGNAITLTNLTINQTGAGSNTFAMDANVLTTGYEYIGTGGTGVFNQTGGVNTIVNALYLATSSLNTTSSAGTYSMSNDSVLLVKGSETVGVSGAGVFNQSGGTHTVLGSLTLGSSSGSSGIYSMSNGTTLSVKGSEYIGDDGAGTFNQTGGNHTAGPLYIAYGAYNTGSFNFSGGNSSFTSIQVGYYDEGVGSLNISGGSMTVANEVNVGIAPGTQLNLTGGSLTAGVLYLSSSWSRLNFTSGTLTLTGTDTTAGNGNLIISGTGGSTATLNHLGNGLSVNNGNEIIGSNGTGIFNQSGGTNSISGNLQLASTASGIGSATISGGTVTVPNVYIGGSDLAAGGKGALTLSGGSMTLSGAVKVWNTPNSLITLSGGTLTTASIVLPDWNRLVFNAGTLSLNGTANANAGDLIIGAAAGGSSTVNLSSNASLSGGNDYVGYSGTAVFNQTGGTHTASTALYVGYNAGSVATYNVSGSAVISASGVELIGYSGAGTFNQSGGSHTVGVLQVGVNATGVGALNISAGTLSATGIFLGGSDTAAGGKGTLKITSVTSVVAGGIKIWNSDSGITINGGTLSAPSIAATDWNELSFPTGILNLNGGTSSNPGNLTIGNGTGVTTATMNFSAGTLGVGGTETIGLTGSTQSNGFFNQSGGTHSAAQLYIGYNASSGGTFSMSNSASLAVIGGEYVGFNGLGTFNQTGGSHTTSTLQVGVNASGTGTVNFSGGTLTAASVFLGGSDTAAGGRGIMNITGGTVSVAGAIKVWNTANSGITIGGGTVSATVIDLPDWNRLTFNSGTLSLSGNSSNAGTLMIGVSAVAPATMNLTAGSINALALQVPSSSGGGIFNQSGGVVTINQSISMTPLSSRAGVYNLSGTGTLVASDLLVAGAGNALYNQTGGTATFSGGFTIGGSSGSGTGNLSGGVLSALVESFGSSGTGVFNHSSGTNNAGTLNIGVTGAQGTYSLSGDGNLVVAGDMVINGTPTGTLNQMGGKLTTSNFIVGTISTGAVVQSAGTAIATSLSLGKNSNGVGNYTLNNSGSLTINGDEAIGSAGTGTFTQNGGVHTVNGSLSILPVSGRTANYILGGTGVLNAANVVMGGAGGTAGFIQSGGTHTVSNLLTINGPSNGYTLNGGSLNAAVRNNNTFTETGGTYSGTFFNGGTLILSGGTFLGTLVNNATFTYSGGQFLGTLIHNGTMSISTALTIGDGLENDTTVNVPAGGVLTINGQGLANLGTISITAGTLAVNGAGLNNQATVTSTGTLTGSGPLVNNAQMTASGTISGSGGFFNNVQLTSAAPLTLSNTGANDNAGTVTLTSGVQFRLGSAGVVLTNNGAITLNGASITGTGLLINAAGGIVQGRGTIASNFSNAGGVLLLADAQTNVSLPFANSSVIQLSGVSANLTGGAINNTGTIQGVGSVGNAIVNNGTITPQDGTLTLGGNVTNNAAGAISVPAGGRLLVTAGLVANAGSISVLGGTFDNNNHALANTGQIAGANVVLRASVWSNAGQIAFTSGANYIFGGLTNTAGGKVIVTGSATATFNNTVNGSAGSTIDVSANSTAIFLGSVTGPITFSGGGAKYFEAGQSSAGPIAAGGVTNVEVSASLTADQIVEKALNISGQLNLRPNSPTSKVNSLTIENGGKLDISNNALIVDYTGASPIDSVRSAIIHGALTSSSLAPGTSIGYAEASEMLSPAGGHFQGVAVDGTSVLVRYTMAGDTNLDGTVGFADLVAIAQHYGVSDGTATWFKGDLNNDGNVDFADLVAVAQNYGSSLPSAPIGAAAGDFNADFAAIAAQVPEPCTAAFLLASGSFALARRRRLR